MGGGGGKALKRPLLFYFFCGFQIVKQFFLGNHPTIPVFRRRRHANDSNLGEKPQSTEEKANCFNCPAVRFNYNVCLINQAQTVMVHCREV